MAYCDYIHCAVCDSKAIYDAELNYDNSNLGNLVALCKECAKTHIIKVEERKP